MAFLVHASLFNQTTRVAYRHVGEHVTRNRLLRSAAYKYDTVVYCIRAAQCVFYNANVLRWVVTLRFARHLILEPTCKCVDNTSKGVLQIYISVLLYLRILTK